MRARLLVAITSDNYVRNYLRTDAFSSLASEYDIDIVADNSLSLKDELRENPNFLEFFNTNPTVSKRHDLLFSLLMWRNRKKSHTFRYRWIRNAGWDAVTSEKGPWRRVVSFLRWLPGAVVNPKGLRIVILGSFIVFPIAQYLLKKNMPISPDLERIVGAREYKVLVFPSAAFDSVSVDLARLAALRGTQSLCLIDNWDNLTSKTSFWVRPNHLGVWGEQTKEQAIRIHGFDASQVHPIGTPRFDQYFAKRTETLKNTDSGRPYLLFVGSAMPFDELGALKAIERFLDSQEAKFANLRIIYRPHPWQQKRNCPAQFNADSFSRTTLDPQIASAYKTGFQPEATDPAFQPELDYYPGLFRGAQAVVGPLTTMLFEAALSLRPVVGLAYPDGFHSNTSRRYFTHFEGIDTIPGFSLCEKPTDLGLELVRAVSYPPISAASSDAATSFFLHRTAHGYPNQLARLISQLTAD